MILEQIMTGEVDAPRRGLQILCQVKIMKKKQHETCKSRLESKRYSNENVVEKGMPSRLLNHTNICFSIEEIQFFYQLIGVFT